VLWKRFIAYEKTNPQRLDAAAFKARVIFAYKQALMCLRHYPEMWHEYAMSILEPSLGGAGSSVAASAVGMQNQADQPERKKKRNTRRSGGGANGDDEDAPPPAPLPEPVAIDPTTSLAMATLGGSTTAIPATMVAGATTLALDECAQLLKEACDAVPYSILMHFIWAEFEEEVHTFVSLSFIDYES
jgi:hypothetical protein